MIIGNFSSISISETVNSKEELALRLDYLSQEYRAVSISIADFTNLLGVSYDFFTAHNMLVEPITQREVLQSGLYFIMNHMKIYVTKHLQEGQYQIEE